jgi:hypothetical protein
MRPRLSGLQLASMHTHETLCGNHTNSQQQKRAAQHTRTLALALTLALTVHAHLKRAPEQCGTGSRAQRDGLVWDADVEDRSIIFATGSGQRRRATPAPRFRTPGPVANKNPITHDWPSRSTTRRPCSIRTFNTPKQQLMSADALAHLPHSFACQEHIQPFHTPMCSNSSTVQCPHMRQEQDTRQHNGFCLQSRRGRVWAHSPRGPRSDAIAPSIAIFL